MSQIEQIRELIKNHNPDSCYGDLVESISCIIDQEENIFKLSIGDWSQDGHNVYREYYFKCNKPLDVVQEGYRQSCRDTGFQFHHRNTQQDYSRGFPLFTEYEEWSLPQKVYQEFISVFPKGDDYFYDREEEYVSVEDTGSFAEMLMEFISLSIPGFKYEKVNSSDNNINGWWGNLNHSFGYGLFS